MGAKEIIPITVLLYYLGESSLLTMSQGKHCLDRPMQYAAPGLFRLRTGTLQPFSIEIIWETKNIGIKKYKMLRILLRVSCERNCATKCISEIRIESDRHQIWQWERRTPQIQNRTHFYLTIFSFQFELSILFHLNGNAEGPREVFKNSLRIA